MNAFVPLNVAALRVSLNDATSVVQQFAGRSALFERLPTSAAADALVRGLDQPPFQSLGAGIHLHWELPDVFRRGVQPPDGGDVTFPHAPNRWLVVRFLRVWNAQSGAYGPLASAGWIVESDYLSPTLVPDRDGTLRPAVTVPVAAGTQPYQYMGRVVPLASWNPATEPASSYLPGYAGPDGKPLYLTSIGFVGPGFCSYYPDCCSVFGFWDRFDDVPDVYQAIQNDTPLQFVASYQVVGWLADPASDPLAGLHATVVARYDRYVEACAKQNVPVTQTPLDVVAAVASESFRWTLAPAQLAADVSYTLEQDGTLDEIALPAATLCSGVAQEIVWNMETSPGTATFLAPGVWSDTIDVAIGNTTVEALSALLKFDVGGGSSDPNVLSNYEYLLDALQLNLLRDLEPHPNKIVALEEGLHAKAFGTVAGGYVWQVRQRKIDPDAKDPDEEVTLPLDLAERLALLNLAQKAYDQGRAALSSMRRQLFMDWMRYVKMYAGGQIDPYVPQNVLSGFLVSSGACELDAVVAAGTATGILSYDVDAVTGEVTLAHEPPGTDSLAAQVWAQYRAMLAALAPYAAWKLDATPAPPFSLPTDPVVLMEGDRLEPVRRNGPGRDVAVRLSPDGIGELAIGANGATFTVACSSVAGLPTLPSSIPARTDVQSLLAESVALVPSFADGVASVLRAQGGDGNPAVHDYAGVVAALRAAQGGLSPLEGAAGGGLYAAVRASSYQPAANPAQHVTHPLALTFTFTNAGAGGWAPSAVGWNAQTALPAFSSTRADPFMPVSLIWTVNLFPFRPGNGASYAPDDVSRNFTLDADAVDYAYGLSPPLPLKPWLQYTGSVVLSQKPVSSITAQIENYRKTYPRDAADPALEKIAEAYRGRNIVSQAIGGFNLEQTLRAFVPQVPVQDLVMGLRDAVTTAIADAARADANDDWYDFGFNTQEPIANGPLAQGNFGPLRSGFLEIAGLQLVDVFGQRMSLATEPPNGDGTLRTIVAAPLQPLPDDTAHAAAAFLPPRLLFPTRLWFRWLSAVHNDDVSGVSADFVEMNSHPATSPVCGWVLPNHLEQSLFFYDADGAPIGSFGVEHGTLTYRTRPGNVMNPDLLAKDIGEPGAPTVNPHVATFMWYVDGRDGDFLADLMATILASDAFLNPANFAQNPALAVLIGRPLALTRAVVGLETSGGVLPLSQADTAASDPFPSDVLNGRYEYAQRERTSSGGLAEVRFPVRLGDLANLDDGLVGYLVEGAPVTYTTFYSAAAPKAGKHGVVRPSPSTLELLLNRAPAVVTMLVDPRAGVHATTGILPVATLAIPPDQYLDAMQSLAISFRVLPVLRERRELAVPLPLESGYAWSWIAPGEPQPTPLQANAVDGTATYDYTPQRLLEGWAQLRPDPHAKRLPQRGPKR